MHSLFRALCWLGLALAAPAHAVLTIQITRGAEGALPVAVVPFGTDSPLPVDIAQVVTQDLERTGRFRALRTADMPGRPTDSAQVEFRDWRRLGTENLVVGRVVPQGGGLNVEFQLLDVFKGNRVAGFTVPSRPDGLRRTAHQIADIIYERLTGERGSFDTRIAYVTASSRGGRSKLYGLEVADSDGHNPQRILESPEPILSPAWSPDGRRLAYVSYEGGRPGVFVQNLAAGSRDQVSAFEGINGAPAWSPDGSRLALTLSKDGNPEIYVLDLGSRALTRVTSNAAIDTEPAWAPDSRSLVFTSDRGGKPQIYRVSPGGGPERRVTFEGEYNARASFAPDGSRLTLVTGGRGGYRVGLLDLETGALRVLTEGPLDESPSFSPNGAMVLYATGSGSLAAVSVDGRVQQRLSEQRGSVREPAWSPLRD
jgi:TolB protein